MTVFTLLSMKPVPNLFSVTLMSLEASILWVKNRTLLDGITFA